MTPDEPIAWRASDAIKRRRRRTRTILIVSSATTVILTGAMLLLFPMSWRRPAASPPGPARLEVIDASSIAIPRVKITIDAVEMDGIEVGRTASIVESQRLQRVDGLFDALKRRRHIDSDLRRQADGDPVLAVELDVDPEVPAVVVKSVFQTAAFAGYTDIRFVVRDGGSLRVGE